MNFLKLLTAPILVPLVVGTPLSSQDEAPKNPHAGQPYCPTDPQLIQNLDSCNDGDTVLELNAPVSIPSPPPRQKGTGKFVDLFTQINKGDAATGNLVPCRARNLVQRADCRPQYTIEDYTLELEADPMSGLSLTLDFGAAKEACPYGRLQDYEFSTGERRGTRANATLLETSEDVTAADGTTFLDKSEAELSDLLHKTDQAFQDNWHTSVYDYAGIAGTALDFRRPASSKIKRASHKNDRLEARDPGMPGNLAAAVHRKGDLRLFLFGFVPTIMASVSYNRLQPAGSSTGESTTWQAAVQQSTAVIVVLSAGLIMNSIRNRWRPRRDPINAVQRLLVVIATKILAFFGAASRRGQSWLTARNPPNTNDLPDLSARLRALDALLSGGLSTSATPQLTLPEPPTPQYQSADMTIQELDTMRGRMAEWSESFQTTCETMRAVFEVAAQNDANNDTVETD